LKHFLFVITLLFIVLRVAQGQQADSLYLHDSGLAKKDTLLNKGFTDSAQQTRVNMPVYRLENRFLNTSTQSISLYIDLRKRKNNDSLFYLIAGIVLMLALFRFFYSRYFTNLFRVFFNTSLRQSQLTDQLLQAKLPSLLFNLFFVLSGGVYVYIVLLYYGLIDDTNRWLMIGASVLVLALIYLIKYCTLKFTGWVTGLVEATDTYVFVIFLINKIIGVFLIPFIIILAFADPVISRVAVTVSLLCVGLFLLIRIFRSYGLLQNQLKISGFHFLLYIAGIEVIPLLLIYKGLMLYLSKNL
jgi:hypothetical protein